MAGAGAGRRLTAVGTLWLVACKAAAPQPPPPVRLVIATAGTAGVYHPLGRALADIFNSRVPGVQATAMATTGSVFNVRAVEGGGADVAFTQGDVAYSAYRQGTNGDARPYSGLRAMAVLYTNAVQVVTPRSGAVRRIGQLRGLRVGVGPKGSGTELAARLVLEAHGLGAGEIRAESLSFGQTAERLTAGGLDAAFMLASFPIPAIDDANAASGVRLVPVDPEAVSRVRESHPFFRPIVIPRGTYAGQEAEVKTLGVDNLLVCRAGLDEELVHRLTRVLLDALPDLARVHVAAASIDPEQAPAAPIPLHPGAARFYRERELSR